MKLSKVLLLVLSLILLCYASGSKSFASERDNTKLPQIDPMEIVTGTATGSWVPIGAAIAEGFNAFYNGFPATAIAGSGSMGNPPMLGRGDGDISMSYAPFLIMAVKGVKPYDKAYPNLRAVAAMQPTILHWRITDSFNNIKNVSQFTDNNQVLKLGIPPMGNANYYFMSWIFNEIGINVDDLGVHNIKLYISEASGITQSWKNRQVDSAINIGNIPLSDVTEALTGRSGHLLNINGNIAAALSKKYGFSPYTIKAGTYPGQDEDIETVALKLVVIVREDMDEDIVYNLAKAIHENKNASIAYHRSFEEFDPNTMHQGCGIELHPGAIKYYKEIGLL